MNDKTTRPPTDQPKLDPSGPPSNHGTDFGKVRDRPRTQSPSFAGFRGFAIPVDEDRTATKPERVAMFNTSDGIGSIAEILVVDGVRFTRSTLTERGGSGFRSDDPDVITVQSADLRRLVIAARSIDEAAVVAFEDVIELRGSLEPFDDLFMPDDPHEDEPSDPTINGFVEMLDAWADDRRRNSWKDDVDAYASRDLAERIVTGLRESFAMDEVSIRLAIMEETIERRLKDARS